MKQLLLLCLLCAAGPVAPAQPTGPPRLAQPRPTKADPQVYELTQNGLDMSVQYIDQVQCAQEFEKQAQEEHWSAAHRAEQAALVPAGGYLALAWGRAAVPLAAGANFELVVAAPTGGELLRQRLSAPTARPLALGPNTVYTNAAMVALSTPLADGVRVSVVEEGAHKRFEFLIHP